MKFKTDSIYITIFVLEHCLCYNDLIHKKGLLLCYYVQLKWLSKHSKYEFICKINSLDLEYYVFTSTYASKPRSLVDIVIEVKIYLTTSVLS